MWLCRNCHRQDQANYGCDFDAHMEKSRGGCESCRKVTNCVNCTSYKTMPQKTAKGAKC